MSKHETRSLIREATAAAHSFTQRAVDGSPAIGMAAIASAISDLAEAINASRPPVDWGRPDGGSPAEAQR